MSLWAKSSPFSTYPALAVMPKLILPLWPHWVQSVRHWQSRRGQVNLTALNKFHALRTTGRIQYQISYLQAKTTVYRGQCYYYCYYRAGSYSIPYNSGSTNRHDMRIVLVCGLPYNSANCSSPQLGSTEYGVEDMVFRILTRCAAGGPWTRSHGPTICRLSHTSAQKSRRSSAPDFLLWWRGAREREEDVEEDRGRRLQ